ncbi:MAG: PAS domain-containing protein [Acidimicrobiia bacterium]
MEAAWPAATNQVEGEALELYASLLQGRVSDDPALVGSQQLLQLVLDTMTNAAFCKDRNSNFIGCNEVFAKFCGIDADLLLGRSDRDMPWGEDDETYDAEWYVSSDQEVIESGAPLFGIVEQLRRSDGETRWIRTNKVPLRDADGSVIGVFGTFEDVTDRRKADEALQNALDELDQRVQDKTTEMARANESLRREVDDRIRLQAEERQQRALAEALRDTAAAISQTFELEAILQEVLTGVERLVSNDLAGIVLVEPDGTYRLTTRRTGLHYPVDNPSPNPDELADLSIVERLARVDGPVIIESPPSAIGPGRSVAGARIRVGRQLIGIMFVESATAGFFTDRHVDRLTAVADQSGAAISNSRLATRATDLAASEERQRLARELHDAVNQTLWTAALTSETLLRDHEADEEMRTGLERLHRLTRGALAEMRSLLLELRPEDLGEMQLHELIEQLVTALQSRKAIEVLVEVEEVDLGPDERLAFYRIAQESIGNADRHSEASTLEVRLSGGERTELSVEDDGIGFDLSNTPAGHFGLRIMQERAAAVDAELSIEAEAGVGTTVRVWIDQP